MLHYEALRQLTHERLHERELEARAERLALQASRRRRYRARRLALAAGWGHLLAGRRHATQ